MIRLAKPTVPKLSEIAKDYEKILQSGMLTNFEFVKKFETASGKFLGNGNTIAVTNGSAGLLLAAKIFNLKGEVILPSFTYSSTGHALLWNGVKPVFADIDPETFNVDPDDIKRKITPNTSAIFVVHCFGNPADINEIEKIAKQHGLLVVYDAAHAFGSRYNGQSLAKFGDAVVYSFTPTKVLTAGEGGLIAISKPELIHKFRIGRENGDSFDRNEEFLGITARLTEFNALLGLKNLQKFKKDLQKRLKLVKLYKQILGGLPGIRMRKVSPRNFSVYYNFVIVLENRAHRDTLLKLLKKNDIQAKAYFYPPLHRKTVYRRYAKKTRLPNTDWLSDRIISLPLYTSMTVKDIRYVCKIIQRFIKTHYEKF